jgi:hypothetical protein
MLAALWWGSLTAVGFVVVPLLFAHLPTPRRPATWRRAVQAQSWVSLACWRGPAAGVAKPACSPASADGIAPRCFIWPVWCWRLLVEFAVAPRIVARENLRLWHSLGSACTLLQWVCAAVVFWRWCEPQGWSGWSALMRFLT